MASLPSRDFLIPTFHSEICGVTEDRYIPGDYKVDTRTGPPASRTCYVSTMNGDSDEKESCAACGRSIPIEDPRAFCYATGYSYCVWRGAHPHLETCFGDNMPLEIYVYYNRLPVTTKVHSWLSHEEFEVGIGWLLYIFRHENIHGSSSDFSAFHNTTRVRTRIDMMILDPHHSAPFFLGLDSSTQALKASLLSSDLDVLSEIEVRFDADLSSYGTQGGVLRGPEGSGEVFSPVMQVVEAMDMLFDRMKAAEWNLGDVRGVAAAGQQHASIYWSQKASSLLANLDPGYPIASQLKGAFSRGVIPNWQDSSTTSECLELEAAFGGAHGLARATGSKAHTRFTASQILKFRRSDPEAYAATARISLVSSFITTILCADGEIKGIDESDVCGMNLWDMESKDRGWREEIVAVVAGDDNGGTEELRRKLGDVETDGGRVVGNIGKWFQARYGFSDECVVFPGTGDNPATFLSLTLRESEALISLGTSDVVLVSTTAYKPHPEYHAFFHPAQVAPPSSQDYAETKATRRSEPMRYFNMLVYKNGSLTREHVRNIHYSRSWDLFNQSIKLNLPRDEKDPPTTAAFWWLLPDIIPANAEGVYKYDNTKRTEDEVADAKSARRVEAFTSATDFDNGEALAIIQTQMLGYRARSSAILRKAEPSSAADYQPPRLGRIYATGGAAANTTILDVMADCLGCPVLKPVEFDPASNKWINANWNACSVGVAYKAKWGWERHVAKDASRKWVGFDQVVAECRERRRTRREDGHDGVKEVEGIGMVEEGFEAIAVPHEGRRQAYEGSLEWWAALEKRALAGI